MTQSVVAAHMGKGVATISDWEKGKSEPTLQEILGLAKLLKTSPAKLAFGNTVIGKTEIAGPLDGLKQRREVRALVSQLEKSISAAGGDPMKLGWLHEQMRVHLAPPAHWMSKEEMTNKVLARSYEIQRELEEEEQSEQAGEAPQGHHGQSAG